jgi:hypothetical protein
MVSQEGKCHPARSYDRERWSWVSSGALRYAGALMGLLPSWTGYERLPPDLWHQLLTDAREMADTMRSLGADSEADQLEREIVDVKRGIAQLLASPRFDRYVHRATAVGHASAWPSGHLGWVFSGLDEYERGARSFLGDGVARRERLIFIADDPEPSRWPQQLLESGELIISSTTEVYGAERLHDLAILSNVFATAADEALRDGYTGVRVAADDTSLVAGADRLEAWIEWEKVADRLIAAHPISALCSFDQTKTSDDALRVIKGLHRVLVSQSAGPPTILQTN